MNRREFTKSVIGGLMAVVVPTFTAIGHLESKEGYGTWVYRRLDDPHGNRSYWHPVFRAGGYCGDDIGRGWVKFSDDMVSDEEWREFIRKYQAVREAINHNEVVKDDELQEMDIHQLLHTLYRTAYYLRYHGVSEELIHSAVRNRKDDKMEKEKPKCLTCNKPLTFFTKGSFWICLLCYPPNPDGFFMTEDEIFGDMSLPERKIAGADLRLNHGMQRKWSWE